MTVIIKSGATDLSVINVLYDSILVSGTVTTDSATDGFPASNVYDSNTWNEWKPLDTSSHYIQVDAGSAVTCDAMGIASHTVGSVGGTLSLQYSYDTVSWSSVLSETPANDDDILALFAPITARYWRLVVTQRPTIGVLFIGGALKFPCAPISSHKPLHHARKVTLLTNISMGGHRLGNRPVKQEAMTNVNIGQVYRDWAETDLVDFETHYNEGGAFFYCGSPNDTPKDMGYCWRPEGGSEMSVTWVEGDVMADVNFEIKAFVPT